MRGKTSHFVGIALVCLIAGLLTATAWDPLDVKSDPLVRMPGTQPDQITLEAPGRCLNCHAGYNTAVEPGFNWKGSMMAQAARDFLFWACLTVGAQDSVWAAGRPNATDICVRCHFPKGWLEGRSDPTNASLMVGADYDGVQCDFCHTMYDPFYQDTYDGVREPVDWDETNLSDTPSQPAADATYAADATEAQAILTFGGLPFFVNNRPFSPDYIENGSGQYFVGGGGEKRASFADAAARHQMLYSRHHKSRYFCASCHDVSNPILANLLLDDPATPALHTEEYSAHSYFHVERTFSEFMLSAYGQDGGAPGIGPFAPDQFDTSNPGNAIAKCQDCHMRDVVGVGCDKKGVPVRPDDSIEHPASGQPLHDMTGGNAWVSYVLASTVPGSANYDATNDGLLNQGPAVLTLDLTQGEGIDPVALLAGVDRAKEQLSLAAAIQNVAYNDATGDLSFRVQNQTGHRLISGFPEGRRMFINIKAYTGGSLVYEVNPYDAGIGTLKGLPHSPSSPPLGANEVYVDELVYEAHPSSSLTGEAETFHFALADGRYKDNRIPPVGYDLAGAAGRVSQPVWHGTPDAPGEPTNYYTAAEYAGGYDDVNLADFPGVSFPTGAEEVVIGLYYQTTSREYVEFLRDEINGYADPAEETLSSPTPSGEPEAYIVQTDPWFAQLKAWGDTIWQLWTHNKDVPGAAPFLMASAGIGACEAPTPTLLSANPGHNQVVLSWSDEHSGDSLVTGYNLYYDQAGKAQLVTSLGLVTAYTDTGLTDGQEYCYKVTSLYADCESGFSNILCATPQPASQAGVESMLTGRYETTGQGKNKVTIFVETDLFAQGDGVVIRATVVDSGGAPIEGAVIDVRITGPETADLVSGPSDASGIAEAVWNTSAPNKKGQGGTTPGAYTATTAGVTLNGYVWDGVPTSVNFTIQ
jgi:hypothetical protein